MTLVREVSDEHIEVELEDGRVHLIGRDCGVVTENVYKVIVTFYREPLTDGICLLDSTYERRRKDNFDLFGEPGEDREL